MKEVPTSMYQRRNRPLARNDEAMRRRLRHNAMVIRPLIGFRVFTAIYGVAGAFALIQIKSRKIDLEEGI
ncbi:hypothetical protein QO002_000584 [Pararhizobium capsulatum DSM 1112]|uniref:Uncharacterized protein n=1 Tax=Pararhizobium capsulatum DSM 1112 TaxID=1121113 RepID=A0ABU0BJL4_9HYPH|nr:hypothetical protein [Pararhizobium capsulatum]MDQ0318446.1 hypothetical protein [Pararhizobium capsulatum DSM 1112]